MTDHAIEAVGADVLRTLVDHLREVLFVRDPRGQRMLYVNPVFEELWGVSCEALYADPRAFVATVIPEDRDAVVAHVRAQEATGRPFDFEYRIHAADGTLRWIHARTFFVRDPEGEVVRVVGIAEDVTARKQAHAEVEALRRDLERQVEERTERLRASLADKELLLREVHHRVKNNLQLVSSLLYLQAQRTGDAAARRALEDSRARIRSIATVHDHLYQSASLELVDLDEYVAKLVSAASHASLDVASKVSFTRDINATCLSLERAMPCGLIINELLTNALKHAFPDERGGNIVIEARVEAAEVHLTVRDDGKGFDPARTPNSLGLQLVRTLVDQLEGTLTIDGSAGATFRIRFPSGAITDR